MKVPLPHLAIGIAGLFLIPVAVNILPTGEAHIPPPDSQPSSTRKPSPLPSKKARGQSRELWKNPLIQTGLSVGYEGRYSDYLSTLGLTEEEHHYFCSLLSERSTETGQIELQWAASTHEQKAEALESLHETLTTSNALIRQFLNHEGDYQLFLDYEARLPDREALSHVNVAGDLSHAEYSDLLEELYQARAEIEEATGCEFENWRFLAEHQDLALLETLREEADRKIQARLSGVLPPDKEELFLAQWNDLRKRQRDQSRITLGLLLEERS
ncbi:hypothetical protein V2O64_11870 [Verrucomicrobiaceae bacterium 227]